MDRREFLAATSSAAAAVAVTTAATAGAPGAETAASAAPAPAVESPAVLTGARMFRLALPRALANVDVATATYRLAAGLQRALAGTTTVAVIETDVDGHAAVSSGSADIYVGLEAQHAHLHPAFHAFSGLPIGEALDPSLHHAWLTAGPGADLMAEVTAAVGTIVFPVLHTGRSVGLLSDRLLETPDDLNGLSIACHGLAREVVGRLGAVPLDAAEPRMPAALAGRGLDASEPLVPAALPVTEWVYGPGLTPGGFMLTLGLEADHWYRLTESDRAIIRGLAGESFARAQADALMRDVVLADVAAYRRRPVHTAMPTAIRAALEAAARDAIDGFMDADPLSRRVFASHRALRASAATMHERRPAA